MQRRSLLASLLGIATSPFASATIATSAPSAEAVAKLQREWVRDQIGIPEPVEATHPAEVPPGSAGPGSSAGGSL